MSHLNKIKIYVYLQNVWCLRDSVSYYNKYFRMGTHIRWDYYSRPNKLDIKKYDVIYQDIIDRYDGVILHSSYN